MGNPQGSFIWYELLTSDLAAARSFYQDVMGWNIAERGSDLSDMDYRMIDAPDATVGGAMEITAEMREGGARPTWLGYICVEDVDAVLAAIVADGGTVWMPANSIPNVGRIALVTDPQGAPFYIMKPIPPADSPPDATSTAFDPEKTGHVAWNELTAADHQAVLPFYTRHFGWQPCGAMSMGEMGNYQFIKHADVRIGAMMDRPKNGPPPHWSYYWRVDDIDAATKRATAGGATILHGPAEVPGGDYITLATDPQGAIFAMVGKQLEA